jgi:hypothetical protein
MEHPNGGIRCRIAQLIENSFLLAGAGAGGGGGKVGLPALDVALAFPQATPASLFPPAGEPPRSLVAAAASLVLVLCYVLAWQAYVCVSAWLGCHLPLCQCASTLSLPLLLPLAGDELSSSPLLLCARRAHLCWEPYVLISWQPYATYVRSMGLGR